MLNNNQKNQGDAFDRGISVCYNEIKVLEPIFIDYFYDYYLARALMFQAARQGRD